MCKYDYFSVNQSDWYSNHPIVVLGNAQHNGVDNQSI